MNLLDQAKTTAEKAAHDAAEAIKSASAKVSDLAGDAMDVAKTKGAELGADLSAGMSKAGEFAAQTYNEVAEQAKVAAGAALNRVETWTGKDLDGDGHIGAEKKE
jgi:hypothetical protein